MPLPASVRVLGHAHSATSALAKASITMARPSCGTMHASDKTEPEARRIINTWVKNGVLTSDDYENPTTRKTVKGLQVVNSKRPT